MRFNSLKDYDVEDVEHDFRFRNDRDNTETLKNVEISDFKILNDGGRRSLNLTQVESTG